MDIELTKIRKSKKITQKEAAIYLGIPYRTYQSYEENINKANSIKYKYMIEHLKTYGQITETIGVLKIDDIKSLSKNILKNYETEYAFVIGEYAKGKANGSTAVSMVVASKASGLRFFKLSSDLKEVLKKKIILHSINNIKNDEKLLNETLLCGVRIF